LVDGGVARAARLGFEAYTEAVGREADATHLDRDPMRYLHLGEGEDQVRPHLPEVLSSERLRHGQAPFFARLVRGFPPNTSGFWLRRSLITRSVARFQLRIARSR